MTLTIFVGVISWWNGYYGDHQLVSVSIRFLHLAGLVLGGGTGLFADRQVLRAARSGAEPPGTILDLLNRTHTYVISWILIVGITGVLMTAADTDTFLVSKVYWIKMALVALLVSNGAALLLLERRASRVGVEPVWSQMVLVATLSAILWLATLFAGVLLTVAA